MLLLCIFQTAGCLSIPSLRNKIIIIIIIYFRDKPYERFLALKGRHSRIIDSLSLYTDYEMAEIVCVCVRVCVRARRCAFAFAFAYVCRKHILLVTIIFIASMTKHSRVVWLTSINSHI